MRLSLAVLGLLGATTAAITTGGCDASNDSESQAGGTPTYASAEAYDQNGSPVRVPGQPGPPDADGVDPDSNPPQTTSPAPDRDTVRTTPREPPTPPAHVNELFRTPGGNGVSQPSPAPPPPANPTSVQTTKPAPPPPPAPPPHRPRPWGGNDPCPPCGMG